jgi:predicted transcriptional regulator
MTAPNETIIINQIQRKLDQLATPAARARVLSYLQAVQYEESLAPSQLASLDIGIRPATAVSLPDLPAGRAYP